MLVHKCALGARALGAALYMVSALALLEPYTAIAGEVQDVKTPRGKTTRLFVEVGNNPWVTVVLFAGGKGVVKISDDGSFADSNFLVRTRSLFQARGAVTAVIDAPSDQPYDMYFFRSTEKHAQDVGAVIKHLKAKYGLPVWLIGTSRGTNSVANAGARLTSNKPDGIVLTATMLKENKKGDYVLPMALDKIEMPVLVAHHKGDACRVTPPGLVDDLKKALKNAKPVKVMMYEGGSGASGRTCGPRHYHGFIGIEEKVVSDIMAWVKSPMP